MSFSTHREHSFRPAAAIASGLRVKFNSSGRIEPANAGDQEIGVTLGESAPIKNDKQSIAYKPAATPNAANVQGIALPSPPISEMFLRWEAT